MIHCTKGQVLRHFTQGLLSADDRRLFLYIQKELIQATEHCESLEAITTAAMVTARPQTTRRNSIIAHLPLSCPRLNWDFINWIWKGSLLPRPPMTVQGVRDLIRILIAKSNRQRFHRDARDRKTRRFLHLRFGERRWSMRTVVRVGWWGWGGVSDIRAPWLVTGHSDWITLSLHLRIRKHVMPLTWKWNTWTRRTTGLLFWNS